MNDQIVIGKVVGAFGVRGLIKIKTDSTPDNLKLYRDLTIGNKPFRVVTDSINGKFWQVSLNGIDNRDLAQELVGCFVKISKSQLPKTSENEYYWNDLIGLTVINNKTENIGKVTGLLDSGAPHSVLIVDGDKQHLIPFVSAYILDVDMSKNMIIVDWGLDY